MEFLVLLLIFFLVLRLYKKVLPGVLGDEYDKYTKSVFLSFWINEIPGTITFSSEKFNSSSIPVSLFLTNNFPRTFDFSALITRF